MRKTLIGLFFLCILFVSCNGEDNFNTVSETEIDVSNLKGQWISIDSKSQIKLKNMVDTDMYFISVENIYKSSDSPTVFTKGNGNSNLAKTKNGTTIPVPNERNECKFNGSELDVSQGNIKIEVLHSNTTGDRIILNSTYKGQKYTPEIDYGYDKYYRALTNVNLNSGKYKDLDRSRIIIINKTVVWGGGMNKMSNDCGIFYTNNYFLSDSQEIKKLLDLSSINKFNVYQEVAMVPALETSEVSFELILVNPVALEYDKETKVTETDIAFFVEAPNDSDEYVLDVSVPDECSVEEVYQNMFANSQARYLDGIRKPYFAPMTTEKSNSASYYLGTIDKDFVFCLCWTGEDGKTDTAVKLRKLTADERKNITYITSDSVNFSVTSPTNKLFVVPSDVRVSSVSFSDSNDTDLYFVSGHTSGIGHSGKSGAMNKKYEVREQDILEYFYTREPIENTAGTVICEKSQVIELGNLSGNVTFLLENGNALVPDKCIVSINSRNIRETINKSSICELTLPENSNVSLECSGMGGLVAKAENLVTSNTTFVFIKTNYASMPENYGTLSVVSDYSQNLTLSSNNGFTVREDNTEETIVGGVEIPVTKQTLSIILPAGNYIIGQGSWGSDRKNFELFPYQRRFTISQGQTTTITIKSKLDE